MKDERNYNVKRIPDEAMKYWNEIKKRCKGIGIDGSEFYMKDGTLLGIIIKAYYDNMVKGK